MNKLPVISGSECVKALEKIGFYKKRRKESHIILRRDDPFTQLVVPNHETIENIDDLDLLELVKGILDHKYHSDTAINVSNHQKARIMASINSINSGNYLSEEQADNLVTNWLNQ